MGPRDCQPQLASHLLLSTPQITALGQLPDVPGLCACHPLPECLYCLFEILILLEGPFRTSPPIGPSPAPEAAPQGLQLAWAPLSELSGPFPSLYLNCQGQLLCSGPTASLLPLHRITSNGMILGTTGRANTPAQMVIREVRPHVTGPESTALMFSAQSPAPNV